MVITFSPSCFPYPEWILYAIQEPSSGAAFMQGDDEGRIVSRSGKMGRDEEWSPKSLLMTSARQRIVFNRETDGQIPGARYHGGRHDKKKNMDNIIGIDACRDTFGAYRLTNDQCLRGKSGHVQLIKGF